MDNRDIAFEFLGQSRAHQQVAQIDNDGRGDHLYGAGPGSDQGQGRELTGGGYHTQGHQEGLEPGHAHFPGGDAQGKGNGEIAHTDRDSVPQAFGEPGSARHGLGCFFHIYSHLFISECLPFRPSDGEKADSVF